MVRVSEEHHHHHQKKKKKKKKNNPPLLALILNESEKVLGGRYLPAFLQLPFKSWGEARFGTSGVGSGSVERGACKTLGSETE